MVTPRLNETNYFNYLIQRTGIVLNTHMVLSDIRLIYFSSLFFMHECFKFGLFFSLPLRFTEISFIKLTIGTSK